MTSRVIIPALLISAATLAGCSTKIAEQVPVSDAPAARIIGDPIDCVQTNLIRNTSVEDNRTIDFHMTNGKVYRNTLPYSCASLGFEERFAYKSTNGRLCSIDTITVLQSPATPGPTCGLGKFVPIEIDKQ